MSPPVTLYDRYMHLLDTDTVAVGDLQLCNISYIREAVTK